jgi:plasmid maintenance system antidote protein VapI
MTKKQLKDELELLSKPGDTITETMQAYWITPALMARQMEMSPDQLAALINAEIPLTEPIARKLEETLLIDASFWINHEKNYREKLAHLLSLK